MRTGTVAAEVRTDVAALLKDVRFTEERINEIIAAVPRGIITSPADVGGYPHYRGEPYKDTDGDGMPDECELKHGLNPNDPTDATADKNGDGYTHIEDFINGTDPSKKVDWKDLKNNVDPRAARS